MTTRKDFERAATIVRQVALSHGVTEAALAAVSFELFFQGDNPRFDTTRWRAACFGDKATKPTPVKASPRPRKVW